MPSLLVPPALDGLDEAITSRSQRADALERFAQTRSNREKPGRFWKIDLETISLEGRTIDPAAARVHIEAASPRVIATDLVTAAKTHGELFKRAFGKAITSQQKFAHLTTAFAGVGAFIHVAADASIDDPILVTYEAGDDATIFPYTLVLAERGARVTVIQRTRTGANAFVSSVVEVVTEENADVTVAVPQTLPNDAHIFYTHASRPGRDAHVTWLDAQLGAALCVGEVEVAFHNPGASSDIAALFFPAGSQHVDLVTTVDHIVGETSSATLVKSAATQNGQARYLGNIRIVAHAQGSEANLRDDALLLSKHAHIDSIPALEIAANDVKAYHGATVGALDDEQIFYMTSRGIDRNAAERMIALGFFEPVIERFPTEALREELRTALQTKVA